MRKGIILAICILISGCEFEQPNISGLEPDPTYPWDTDGDWISNNTENNSANDHHGFDPDVANENPSIANGTPTDGSLTGGINIWGDGMEQAITNGQIQMFRILMTGEPLLY